MSYFLTEQQLKLGQTLQVEGLEAKHILLSRRLKKGEAFVLQDSQRKRYEVVVVKTGVGLLTVRVIQDVSVPSEPDLSLDLYISHINDKALDWVLQKSTELGVKKVVIFNSKNSAFVLTKENFFKKKTRWEKIFLEAAKQSDRAVVPGLTFYENLSEITEQLSQYQNVFLCDQFSVNQNGNQKLFGNIAAIVGPEGGFTKMEISELEKLKNLKKIKLSNFVLRAETAAVAVVAILENHNSY